MFWPRPPPRPLGAVRLPRPAPAPPGGRRVTLTSSRSLTRPRSFARWRHSPPLPFDRPPPPSLPRLTPLLALNCPPPSLSRLSRLAYPALPGCGAPPRPGRPPREPYSGTTHPRARPPPARPRPAPAPPAPPPPTAAGGVTLGSLPPHLPLPLPFLARVAPVARFQKLCNVRLRSPELVSLRSPCFCRLRLLPRRGPGADCSRSGSRPARRAPPARPALARPLRRPRFPPAPPAITPPCRLGASSPAAAGRPGASPPLASPSAPLRLRRAAPSPPCKVPSAVFPSHHGARPSQRATPGPPCAGDPGPPTPRQRPAPPFCSELRLDVRRARRRRGPVRAGRVLGACLAAPRTPARRDFGCAP